MTFSQFELSEDLIKSLNEIEYTTPTEVQNKAIPKVLEGKDLIVLSKTGSGKTGAFGIPIIEKIKENTSLPQALILTPTRELAVQVDQDIKKMSKHSALKTAVVYGGHSMFHEVDKLTQGVAIVTGTPGRVIDHIQQGNLKTKEIKYLVLDEADRMLDMGFIDQVKKIIKMVPRERITLLFSATMPPEINQLCKHYMNEPESIEIQSDSKTVDTIEQYYTRVAHNEKRKQLFRILTVEDPESCMVFCNTRIEVDKVNAYLRSKGFAAKAIHGANSQNNRMKSIQQFKKGSVDVLVATDVAARGLHIDDLTMVINYDVPQDKDNYIHRIGSTGRAGNGGKALTLVTSNDLYTLYEIEEHIGAMIPEKELPTEAEFQAMPKREPLPVEPSHSEHKKSNPSKSRSSQSKSSQSKTGYSKSSQSSKPNGIKGSSHSTSTSGEARKTNSTSHKSGGQPHKKEEQNNRKYTNQSDRYSNTHKSQPRTHQQQTSSKPVSDTTKVIQAVPNTPKTSNTITEQNVQSKKPTLLSKIKGWFKK